MKAPSEKLEVVCRNDSSRDEEGNRASLSIGETITEINILILI
jgi:hypothetical protein